jgi:hypothetical protein
MNAHELNAVADVVAPEELLEAATAGKDEYLVEWTDETDDGVEALIISMDRASAEHVFLQAQRDMRRDAAKALLAADQ